MQNVQVLNLNLVEAEDRLLIVIGLIEIKLNLWFAHAKIFFYSHINVFLVVQF